MSREPVMNDTADICPSTYKNVGMGSYFLSEAVVTRDKRCWGEGARLGADLRDVGGQRGPI